MVGPTTASPHLRTSTSRSTTNLYTELAGTIRESGLLRRRHGWYLNRTVAVFGAFALVWVVFAWLGDSWFQLLPAAVLGVVMTQLGFLGHDAAHQQIFTSRRANVWASRVCALTAGLSSTWWRDKHNRHHAAPNQEGRDPDIAPGAVAFTPAAIEVRRSGLTRWIARHQGWLFFPLLTLEGLNLHVASVEPLVRAGTSRERRIESALVVARLAAYVAVLLIVLPPGKAAAFVALQSAVFGLCLGGSFAPNHKGMPIVPPTARIDFLRRQVLMSRNVRGGFVVDAALGGLNYQIEHHLFPSMPRPNLKLARPLVLAYCHRHDVPYTEVGLFRSYAIVVDYLNHVGLRARGPFECPIVATYRTTDHHIGRVVDRVPS